MSICFLNSLPNGKYSSLLIVAALPNNSFPGKIPFPVKNSYLPTLSHDQAEILAFVCPNCIELCFPLFCHQLF